MQKVHDGRRRGWAVSTSFVAYLAVLAVAVRGGDAALAAGVPLLFCCLPVVLVGLWEDITRGVHPWHRLVGAVASAAVASCFAKGIIARVDLPFVDDWLRYLLSRCRSPGSWWPARATR